jgi:hypothetical protein
MAKMARRIRIISAIISSRNSEQFVVIPAIAKVVKIARMAK